MYGRKYGSHSSGVTKAATNERRAQQFAPVAIRNMAVSVTTFDGLCLTGTAFYQGMPYSAAQVRALVDLIRREYEESGKTNSAPLYNTIAVGGVNVYIGSIETVERG